MSSNKNDMMGISFVDLTGATEDTSSLPVGVSSRFDNEEFREMTRRRLMGQQGAAAPQEGAPQAEASTSAEEVRETAERTDQILTEIAGSAGAYAVLPLSSLQPTPEAWNQFSAISNEKKVLMADSIYRNGLQQPLVVRALDQEGLAYQILAGNTRKNIYEVLYDLTGDEKYLSIECKVYGFGELTDDQAREIASDTNYVQRANLTGRDKSFAVRTKLNILKKRGEKQILEKAAQQMGMKRTAAFAWNKMANLIPAFFDMYDEGRLTQNTATRIAAWSHEVQEELYMQSELISEEIIMAIPAKTPSELVPERFQELCQQHLQERSEALRIGSIASVEENEDGYTLHLSGKAPEASQLLVMYLPNKKAAAFRKKYQDYILENEN